MIPPLETTMGCMNDDGTNSWNSQHDLTYNTESDERMQEDLASNPLLFQGEGKETLAEQLMKITNRAMGATRELECAVNTTSLTVNSPPVNEMFEAANALVQIINSLTLADSTDSSLRSSSRDGSDGNDRQLPTEYYPIFLALDSYQRVLSLFHAVCDFIKRSLGSITRGTELQQQTLHGAGSSSAQFIMVLQLMIHLLNRIGRSLRMGNRENIDHHELIFAPDGGGERGCSDSIVDCAQGMLKMLPDEHVKLLKAIRELQACIEESVLI
ncbi:hypothetical protein N7478_000008 [Penicillium angulare]|uniref:uncharacterized protein n=1 Tax=Penicillium angulare TaxID=116970 RepID=UPI00253FF0FD|nr:uncharacterized protein N7478_000008 [Penicillium angulare]KAJ5290757.1 hypothetical protein N7478_000008 [Penicillium angulare]